MFTIRSLARVTALGTFLGTAALISSGHSLRAGVTSVKGPPWISIETPVNPYDATTKDAFLVVHEFHHQTPIGEPLTGTAEGMVNGNRRSVTLKFTPTSRPGAFALTRQWGTVGVWTLVITVRQHEDDVAQALVEIGADGDVTRVQVPTRIGDRNFVLPRELSAREIDAALRQRARASGATK